MSASFEIISKQCANGYGWCSFYADPPANAELSASYSIGHIEIPLAVFSSDVGFAQSMERHSFVVKYPLCGSHEEQLVRIFANDRRIGTIPVTAEPDYIGMAINHFLPKPATSCAPDLSYQHRAEQVNCELLGFWPIDSTDMVVRMRITIPPALKSLDWQWRLYSDIYACSTLEGQVLYDKDDDAGNRIIVLSYKISRGTERALLVVSEPTDTKFPGFLGISKRVRDTMLGEFYRLSTDAKADPNYPAWFAMHRVTQDELAEQRKVQFEHMPLVSIVVPVYQPPLDYLDFCIQSVLAQSYGNWELVLVNASPQDDRARAYLERLGDERVRVIELEENRGIAGNTNAGIAASHGEWLAFLDQDDALEPDALFEYVRAINKDPSAELFYCDEDNFENDVSQPFSPMLKPSFNEDFFYTHNYAVHWLAVSRRALDAVERSPEHLSGAQDYDLMLKVFEIAPKGIRHIPRVLYHWRQHAMSTNAGNLDAKPYAEEAARKAVAEHFERMGYDVSMKTTSTPFLYRPIFAVPPQQKVSAVDPHTGSYDASADILLFCDDDVMANSQDAFELMLGYFQRPNVGAVGPLILDEDGPIRHAGLALMENGSIARLNFGHTLATNKGYLGATESARDYSAVTRECIAVRRDLFERVGGFDSELSGDRASLDLCWKIRETGYLVVYTPYACFTRRWREEHTDFAREQRELATLHLRYPGLFENGDPALNTNCNPNSPYFGLAPLSSS